MRFAGLRSLKLAVCFAGIICSTSLVLPAADIEGTVIVKHRLTKPRVTAPSNPYERGVAVELPSNPETDVLAFERSRVIVFLDGALPSEPRTATLEQKNRQFVPDTLVVPVGSTVSFPNRDLVFHNVFSLSKPKTFDLGNYPKDHTRSVTFPRPGIVFVNCHLHPNMMAVVFVSPNRWSAKADAAGRFVLTGVPPGRYTVVAWHRSAGFFRQNIEVKATTAPQLQFIIPLDAEGARTVAMR